LDLAAMNIQRGRDHGIPGYIEYRRFCNLTAPESWEELAADIPDAAVLSKLRRLYGHLGNIDLWVGGIVENRLPDALVGPTFSCIIADQFRRLRAGDRFWYENQGVFTPLQLNAIRKASLAKVLCNNGDDVDRIQSDVFFYVGNNKLAYKRCEDIADVSLKMWMSCCDETCSSSSASAGSGEDNRAEESSKNSRRRRNLHLYSPKNVQNVDEKTASANRSANNNNKTDSAFSANCDIVEGGKDQRRNGDRWTQGKCSSCKCENGVVWCHSITNCVESRE